CRECWLEFSGGWGYGCGEEYAVGTETERPVGGGLAGMGRIYSARSFPVVAKEVLLQLLVFARSQQFVSIGSWAAGYKRLQWRRQFGSTRNDRNSLWQDNQCPPLW